MPTLLFKSSDGSEQSFELTGELSVGREAGNDVVLGDQGVSRKHCRFYLAEDGQVVVEDLGSANGVTVDGERIAEPTVVAQGSQVIIGGAEVSLAAKKAAPKRPAAGAAPRPGTAKSTALATRPQAAGGARSTRMIQAGDAPKSRPRPQATAGGGAGAGEGGRPRLKGMTGPWAGQQFDISKARLVVGRVAPADIVLEDDSVSRKHAEIVRAGSQVSVRDLGSANGTFVNGEQVSEAPLAPGDTLRFGVIEMSYSGPGAARAAGDAGKKKKILLGVGGGVVLLLVLAVALGSKSDQSVPLNAPLKGAGGGGEGPQEIDVNKMLGQCRAFSDPDNDIHDWNKCVEICGKIIEADPTLVEARKQQTFCKKEQTCDKQIADAKLKSSTAQDEAAIKILVQVDKNCSFYLQARNIFKEATERLGKRKRTDCKTEFHYGNYQKAYEECQRHIEVTCDTSEGPDPEVVRLLQKSAALTGKPKDVKCPAEYKPLRLMPVVSAEDDPATLAAIRKKYPDATVAEGMITFFREGRPKKVSDEFKRQRIKQPKLKDQLDELVLRLDLMDGRYTSGQEGILKNDPNLVEQYWKEAFETDKMLMPSGVSSALARDMKTQLAVVYAKVGTEAMKKDHYNEGFTAYLKGYGYDPQNQEILSWLQKGQQKAKKLLDAGGCENAISAAAFTLDTSALHKQAVRYVEENGCR